MGREAAASSKVPLDSMNQKDLQCALQAHQSGQLAQAKKGYQRVLATHPHHADSLHLLGLVTHQLGDSSAGEKLIRRAIAVNADQISFHTNLGEVCLGQGKNDVAVRAFKKAVKLDPVSLIALTGLAEALFVSGKAKEAVTAYRQALKQAPQDTALWNSLGNAFRFCGHVEDAIEAYQQALQIDGHCAEAIENLTRLLANRGQSAQAASILSSWLLAHGDHPALKRLLAEFQARSWDRRGALATLASLPESQKAEADVILQQGQLLEQLGDIEAAIELYQSAGNRDTHHRGAFMASIGVCYEQLGERQPAEQHYRQALESDGKIIAAWEGLQALGALDADDIQTVSLHLRSKNLSQQDKGSLHFVIAGWLEKTEQFDAAFAHFANGNRLIAKSRPFDPDRFAALHDRVIDTFSRGFFAAQTTVNQPVEQEQAPIFIVGMPRSGTTLAERIIAGHSRVTAGGERDEMRRLIAVMEQQTETPFPGCAAALDSTQVSELRNRYAGWTQHLVLENDTLTDKLPSNYLRLGVIAQLFPQARIIHCRRDPRDTCLSCFTTHFNNGQDFSYDQKQLAQAYLQYRRLMRHWQEVLPNAIFELDYEQLVQQPEQTGKQLLAFCGLDWTADSLNVQEQQTPVRTASLWQVRQPLYSSSIGRWQHFEKHIQPLLSGLSTALGEADF